MQGTSGEQVFPFGILLAVILVVAVAVALAWFIKRTRGGDKPPRTM